MVSMNPLFSIAVLYFDLSVEIPLFDIKGFLSDPPYHLFVSFAKQLTTLQNNVKSCPNFGDVSRTVHLTIIIIVRHNIL
jgi:hypothetical protein